MSLNGAFQSVSIGLASWLGGVLIQRDANGHVTHFWLCALVGMASTLLALWLSQRVEMHSAPQTSLT
jgi:predicted MFS family arabinose efflux permease